MIIWDGLRLVRRTKYRNTFGRLALPLVKNIMVEFFDRYAFRRLYHVIKHQFGVSNAPKITV